MNDQQSEKHRNTEKRNRKIMWSILISTPIIILLIGLIAYIYQITNPIDITNDFLTYFDMPDKRIVLDSGYEAQIISIEKERSKEPVVILTIAPDYVTDGTTAPYNEAVYEWMCIPSEIQKENLRKIAECADTFIKSKGIEGACIYVNFSCLSYGTVTYDQRMDTLWVPTHCDLMKEMYENFRTFSVSDLKGMPEAKEFYNMHHNELESANLLAPLIFFYSNDNGKLENNFINRKVLWAYEPE